MNIRIFSVLSLICATVLLLLFSESRKKPQGGDQFGASAVKTLPESYRNGAWFWESPKDLSEGKIDDLIRFSKEKNIKVIYLFIEDYLYIVEDPKIEDKNKKIEEFNGEVRSFISTANENGVDLEALAGDADWADSSHEYIPHTLLDYVLNFNANPENKEKFAGIQFDIEFYNKEGFKEDKVGSTTNYLSLVSDLAGKIKTAGGGSIRLGFAVPYWLSDGKGIVPKVSFNGKSQTAMEHLLDILGETNSYLALMSYRDQALGKSGSISISKKGVELADNRDGKVKVYIGIETEKNETKSISFYGRNQTDVNMAAQQISEAFSNSKSFSGVAIHTLQGYKDLKE